MIEQDEIIEYNSLNEIRLRKELLRKDIQADDAKIKALWKSLFTKPEALSKNASASKRFSSMMKIGAGAFDGAILAWKLYHKFKRKKSLAGNPSGDYIKQQHGGCNEPKERECASAENRKH